jgi:ADP-ribose pyrophosphatase YjhB (NUDIX family)
MFEWAKKFGMKRYRVPGKGRTTHLDPDEVRRKLRAVEYEPRTSPAPTITRPGEKPAIATRKARAADKAQTADGRPIMAGAIIPHPVGRPEVLLSMHVWHAESAWSWIGGHVRPGEDPADAVIREIHEELEARGARVVRLLGVVDTHVDTSRWWGPRYRRGHLGYHYLVTVESPDVRVRDHEELTRVEWLTLDRVAEAVAELPEEIREADLRFTREAIASIAASK